MLPSRLLEVARRHPDAACVIDEAGVVTWGEMADRAARFATLLSDAGIGRGDRVALMMSNRAEFLVAWFGVSFRGAALVSINTALVGEGLRYTLGQSEPALLVVEPDILEARRADIEAAGIPGRIVFAGSGQLTGIAAAEPEEVAGHDLCSIMYTSGTTGLPKGVMNSFNAFHEAGRRVAEALELASHDRFMVFLPLFHINPQIYAVMSAAEVGASIALRPKFSAGRFFEDAKRFGATGFTYVGTVLSILTAAERGERRDHGLRFCIGGGAPEDVWQAVRDRFGVRVHELYGMTETAAFASLNTTSDYRFRSCGRLRDDMDVRIFDDLDNELPPGEKGEIVIRPKRPFVMLDGYFANPAATQDASRNFWFHTGDLGSFDSDGYLYFHGRKKELIRRGGEMISPVAIETMLLEMPGVLDAAAVGVPDAIQGEEIKVVLVSEGEMEAQAVVRFLHGRIAEFMLPRLVEFVDAIPRTETEKIQRRKLIEPTGRLVDLRAGFKELIGQ